MISKKTKRLLLVSLLIAMPVIVYAASPDIGQMMQNVKRDMPYVVRFIAAVSYIGGFWFVFSALQELKVYGQARTMMPSNANIAGPLTKMIGGILMMFFPGFVNVSIYTLWNYGISGVLVYPTSGKAGWTEITEGVVALIRVIGYIAFVRGLILMVRSSRQGSPPGMMGKALTHLIGGILAVNILGTISAIKGTFGWT